MPKQVTSWAATIKAQLVGVGMVLLEVGVLKAKLETKIMLWKMVILKDNEEESEAKVEVKRVDNTAVDLDEK